MGELNTILQGGVREVLKAPFPWFGGKRRVAGLVWQRLGDVPNYVEPFFGSGAVLLGRPTEPRIETVNDKDGYLANFWRALQADPEAVAHHAEHPVNENDLHARHAWLLSQRDAFVSRLEGDPDFYDAKIAGWWVWGICCWIGGGWCSGDGPWHVVDGQLVKVGPSTGTRRARPGLGGGKGVCRRLVHLGAAGQGVNRQRVHLGAAGQGVNRQGASGRLVEWFEALARRLQRVRVCCGDWTRICGPTPTTHQGLTGVFLDPPYSLAERDSGLYRQDEAGISDAVREWALAHGDDPLMRIALCGYEGEHIMPDAWECVAWKAHGGYGSQGSGRARDNAHRERIWFSPACIRPDDAEQRLW